MDASISIALVNMKVLWVIMPAPLSQWDSEQKKRTSVHPQWIYWLKSTATFHICSRFAESVLIGVIQGHLLKLRLGLFRLEVNGQITIHK